ncbi:uncharacterized protein M421DRAFT_420309 [Didymella exigua CBS 183.55]|uniref:Uncharacterized protein n=1 Tax=Didymella exigua CBS 183.55 TaxID=1150837 RepID=A0A6A5RPV5_9PLEO|nr:uncharacterized protein M421DRAFT_420309 [Didymella exigua CBS 183.55]KAF1929084.1 hypothetical protein M421DRAFT_420309 [Didymella exigua CBS 183.55]
MAASSSKIKKAAKAKLQLVPLVSEILITPQPAKADTKTNPKNSKVDTKQRLKLAPLVSAWSFYHQPFRGHSSNSWQQQKAKNSSGLPFLPPLDHHTFSRFDKIRRQTNNDYGELVEVQTNDGTIYNVHRRVLDQNLLFKKMWEEALKKNPRQFWVPDTVSILRWRPVADFARVSPTYIHWLYNSNLPTAIIDVSNERIISTVLVRLVQEYIVGQTIDGGC